MAAVAAETPVDSNVAVARPLRLMMPRDQATNFLQKQMERGREMRNLRIARHEELDAARQKKLAWVTQSTELLKAIFGSPSLVDDFNGWVPKILPEYACLEAHVEQFHAEMGHRLQRLKAAVRLIPETPSLPRASAVGAAIAVAVAAPAGVAPAAVPETSSSSAPVKELRASAERGAPRSHGTKVLILSGEVDKAIHEQLAGLVKQLGLTAVIAEGAILEEVEQNQDAAFAILARHRVAPQDCSSARAVFELGYAVGRLGFGRVCAIQCEGEAVAEDVGIQRVTLDAGGGWQLHLARAMKRAGVSVDLNRLC